MAARLQRDIGGGAGRVQPARQRVLHRLDLGMILPGRLGEPLADDLAILDEHAADARVGRGDEHAPRGEREGLLHGGVVGIGKHSAVAFALAQRSGIQGCRVMVVRRTPSHRSQRRGRVCRVGYVPARPA